MQTHKCRLREMGLHSNQWIKQIIITLMIFCLVFHCASVPVEAAKAKTPKKVSVKTIKATSVKSTSMTVKWSKAKNAKKYQVAYKVSTSKKWKYKTAKKNSIKLSGLKASTTYKVKIRSINGKKKSKWTSSKSLKTGKKASVAADMLNKVNAERQKRGIAPLKLYSKVNTTAQAKAKDMYKTGKFSHYSPNLGFCFQQYQKAGIKYYAGGENIAYGFSSSSKAMKAWMKSPGHKANILSEDYSHIGVGYYKGYWVQQFICID